MKKIVVTCLLLVNFISFSKEITLEQAIDLSLNNSKEVKISEKNLEISNINVSKALKNALPSLNYSGRYSIGEHERKILPKSESMYLDRKRGYTQSIRIAQPLFAGGSIISTIKGAKAYENIASYTYLKSKIQNRLDTIKIYSNIINAEKNMEALKKSENILEKRYEKQEEQLKLRLITKTDLLRTDYSLKQIQSQIINNQNMIDSNKERLYVRTGIDKNENLILKDFDIPETLTSQISLDRDLKQAVEESLTSKIASEQHKVALATKNAAIGDMLPQVSAFAGYSTTERTTFNRSAKDGEWLGGVEVSWKVFSFGKDFDNYRVAKLEAEKQALNENSVKENVEIEVKSAYLDLLSFEKQKDSQGKALAAAKLTFEQDQERYDAGLLSIIDYLDSENKYRQASINYNKTLLDYYYAFEKYRSLLI
ncbi:TolC family protein [Fusobacterium massiliense]|uniref:TolC family protein n=1 Tax=Fusobacterium massiliense TaxID=1852365 RepID=UPI0028EE026F|nr:TolC family protein [Fusobacterium massiliense]